MPKILNSLADLALIRDDLATNNGEPRLENVVKLSKLLQKELQKEPLLNFSLIWDKQNDFIYKLIYKKHGYDVRYTDTDVKIKLRKNVLITPNNLIQLLVKNLKANEPNNL